MSEDETKYPKINTLWKRDESNRYVIMPGEHSCPEFENITNWHVTEKIDGMNVRIFWDGVKVRFGGRTLNAQIPTPLLNYLQDTFTDELMKSTFPEIEAGDVQVVLYGEGYGVKIQKGGGAYRKDVAFILFDVMVGGWWLKREDVSGVALKLDIEKVPAIGILSIAEIMELVKAEFKSQVQTADDDKINADTDELDLFTFKGKEEVFRDLRDYDQMKLSQIEYTRLKNQYKKTYPSESLKEKLYYY